MSFVRSFGLAAALSLPFSAACAPRQGASLEQRACTYDDCITRANSAVKKANDYEIPYVFDSSLPEAEMIRQRQDAVNRKRAFYEEAIQAYSNAIAARETADAVFGRAVAYWQRAMRTLSFEDVPLAQGDFERVLALAPERTDVHAILGGVRLWRAKFAQSDKSREDSYVAAYQSFFQARANHSKHPITDAKLLQYVDEQLNELNSKIPKERKYH